MSCSLLLQATNTASVRPTDQIEVNINTKQMKPEPKQKQTAETSISGLIKILEQKYKLYKLEDSPQAKAGIPELAELKK